MYVCVYIYIERERDRCMYVCMYIYIYIYTYVYTYSSAHPSHHPEEDPPLEGRGERGGCILQRREGEKARPAPTLFTLNGTAGGVCWRQPRRGATLKGSPFKIARY